MLSGFLASGVREKVSPRGLIGAMYHLIMPLTSVYAKVIGAPDCSAGHLLQIIYCFNTTKGYRPGGVLSRTERTREVLRAINVAMASSSGGAGEEQDAGEW